jgi:hypothetical protein
VLVAQVLRLVLQEHQLHMLAVVVVVGIKVLQQHRVVQVVVVLAVLLTQTLHLARHSQVAVAEGAACQMLQQMAMAVMVAPAL